jgi:uncharacterized protein
MTGTMNMPYHLLFAMLLGQFVLATTAIAQTISFGASQAGGPNYSIALAISKEAGRQTGLDIRVIPQRSPSQVLPLVNANSQQLGATSGLELTVARNGEGSFAGNALTDLRAIGNLFPFRLTYAVRSDSPAKSIADLKGARLASGYRASTTGHTLSSAILEAAGISFDDVEKVEASDFSEAREFFIEGRTDAVHYIVGGGENARIASQAGGLKALGIPSSGDPDTRLNAIHPTLRTMLVRADPQQPGLDEDILVLAYDYVLYTNAQMPDEAVAAIAEALVSEAAAMAQSFPAFNAFNAKRVSADVGIPYHPAALEVYRNRGLTEAK